MQINDMENILKYETPQDYLLSRGIKVLHPLVAVVDFTKTEPFKFPKAWTYGFYAISMKSGEYIRPIKYGRNYYDYKDGTIVFTAPHQLISLTEEEREPLPHPSNWALLFHPDFIRGTSLGRNIKNYSFFSYEVHEALHLSDQEKQILLDCLRNIEFELSRGIDNHSKMLICSNIELFLNYCVRFYDRQFITRQNSNQDTLSKFENLLDEYFNSDLPQKTGLPTVKYCADMLHLSPNYLGDLIKKETGKSAQEHIQFRLVEAAKEKLFEKDKSVSQIAYELGYEYPQYFSRMFKKNVRMTPNEYRGMN